MRRGWTASLVAISAALAPAFAHGQSAGDDLRGTLDDDGRAQALDLRSEASPLVAVFVEGATVYNAEQLASLYADRLGRAGDLAALQALAEEITARYREDGYFLSRAVVPPAALSDGVARVIVYEGYIAEVRFDGPVPPRAAELLSDVVGQRPINLRALDRKLTLLRQTPGLRVARAELEPDVDDPSAHILVLELRQSQSGGYLRADNRGSDDYGGWRITANGEVYNVLRPGDESQVRVVTAPTEPERMRAFEVSYATPVGADGAFVRVEAGAGRFVDDDEEVRDFRSASTRYQAPVRATRDAEHAVFLEAAALSIEERTPAFMTTDETLVSLALGATGRWRRGGGATTYYTQMLLGRAHSPAANLRSRADADDAYARLNLSLTHRETLGEDVTFIMRWAAQLADGPLPRSEEMSVGGRLFGRGYLQGSARGDSGVAGALEARYVGAPDTQIFGRLQPYIFIDGARMFNGYLGAAREDDLASWGGGVRFEVWDRVSLEVEVARALIDARSGENWRQNLTLNLGF